MKRIAFEVGLVVAVLVFGLEAVHYRNAVLACNIDRKRAWKTVVELREKSEAASALGGARPGNPALNAAEKPAAPDAVAR